MQIWVYLSPVPSVFHTEVTMNIGLKTGFISGNIHSTKLEEYDSWQSAQILLLFGIQTKFQIEVHDPYPPK